MDNKQIYKLIEESVGGIIKEIISKHYNSYEKINLTETRIIIDMYIIYIELKNNLNLIIDRLVDKFKITNKDSLFKLLVNYIYDEDTKTNIMSINKIVENSNGKTDIEIKNEHIKYLYEELVPVIFNEQVIDFINYYSNPILIYVYYIKNFFRNWKILLVLIIFIIIIYFTGKKLKNCNVSNI